MLQVVGVMIGRYPGDSYAGGNPWQLLTVVLVNTFCQGASAIVEFGGFIKEADRKAWFELIQLPETAS